VAGRWRGQAPEVDGAVYVAGTAEPGTMLTVRVTDTFGFDLFGEML
jgi:hypothetical protein